MSTLTIYNDLVSNVGLLSRMHETLYMVSRSTSSCSTPYVKVNIADFFFTFTNSIEREQFFSSFNYRLPEC